MIIIKNLDSTEDWRVYHRSTGGTKSLLLNNTDAAGSHASVFNNTDPTASVFTVGTSDATNKNGDDFVAYLFAGGEEGYNSVEFDATTESLSATSSDYAFGTGDFTVEAWIKIPNVSGISYQNVLDTRGSIGNSTSGFSFGVQSNGQLYMYTNGFIINTAVNTITSNQWYHIALVNNGGTAKAYVDGVEKGSVSLSGYDFTNTTFRIANVDSSSGQNFVGSISNVRVVKGTAVYTSAFTAPTAPLTNITNTKLLCCNGDLATSSTVASGTLSASGSPNTTGTSPFTSPDAVFGESESESVIKCGSYTGNGSSTGPKINLGWEPQWVMVKRTDSGGTSWVMLDTMRAWTVKGEVDAYMYANKTDSESVHQWGAPINTGMQMDGTDGTTNASGGSYIYLAIRRSDGYVGKPIELGTDVFAMSYGNGSSSGPCFDSDFAVDFALRKIYGSNDDWWNVNRLTGKKYLKTNGDDSESNHNDNLMDYNDGWGAGSIGSGMQSWMWKRHAGLDVVAYEGDGINGRSIAHSMNDVPEMMIVKRRSSSEDWTVYHTGLNGGTNPYTRLMTLNSTASEVDMTSTPEKVWKSTPTSTHFEIGSHDRVNTNGEDYLALLFSSIDGVSKIGSYTGSTSNLTITTGFQPRFILIKGYNALANGRYWIVMDSLRGINPSGNTDYLFLNQANAQNSNGPEPFISGISSTGFTLLAGKGDTNVEFEDGTARKYIYYAHA
jgi:hypothetical protein